MGGGQSLPDSKSIKRDVVVIPVDQSQQAEAAFEWYAKHVYQPNHKLQILFCQERFSNHRLFPDHSSKRFRRHAYKKDAVVKILYCQEIEHPSGENYPDYAITPEAWSEQIENAKKTGMNLISKYEQKLKEYNMEGSVKAQVGKPGELIVKEACESNAAHIVMGTRGYGIVRRTILGSVSEYVIHHSTVPVTVVPKETQSWFF